MSIRALPTPSLLLDLPRLDANIEKMIRHVGELGVSLRPHAKTAKSIDVIRRVLGPLGSGVTVSTLREAGYFLEHGVTDIIYAVGIAPPKLDAVADLVRRGADLKILVEDAATAAEISKHGRRAGLKHQALIEIDSDGHRAGAAPASREIVDIAERLDGAGAQLLGVLTHAGSSYHCTDETEIRAVAAQERDAAVASAETLRRAGFACPVVSVGSTPTLTFSAGLEGVTEARVGVFMFQDLVMAGLGVCAQEDIALSVLATVIGHRREDGTPITDAGWIALSGDRGTASQPVDQGLGLVCDAAGRPLPDVIVTGANQEHGLIGHRTGAPLRLADFPVGTRLRILPNHACATAAAHDVYHVIDAAGAVSAQWPRCRGWA